MKGRHYNLDEFIPSGFSGIWMINESIYLPTFFFYVFWLTSCMQLDPFCLCVSLAERLYRLSENLFVFQADVLLKLHTYSMSLVTVPRHTGRLLSVSWISQAPSSLAPCFAAILKHVSKRESSTVFWNKVYLLSVLRVNC